MAKVKTVYLNVDDENLLKNLCVSCNEPNESAVIKMAMRAFANKNDVVTQSNDGEIHVVLVPSPEDIVKSQLREITEEIKQEDVAIADQKARYDQISKDSAKVGKAFTDVMKAWMGLK